jgi:hypothetical protein
MRSLARHVWLATVLAAGVDGHAQQAPAVVDSPPEKPLKYRVEFIIFAHAEADPYEELFDKEALPPELSAPADARFGGDTNIGLRGDAVPTPEAAEPNEELKPILPFPSDDLPGDAPFWFRVLDAGELGLANTYARLENLRAYDLLARGGWIQEGLDETAARPMDLATLGIANPTGSLRLYVSRYLHVGVDLEFRAQQLADGNVANSLAELAPLGTKYRMVAQRRARSGELHYVDHPMFGLLFLISPVPEEEAPVEDDTSVLAPAI